MRPEPIGLKEFMDYDCDTGIFTWKKHRCQTATPGRVVTNLDAKGYVTFGWNRHNYRAHHVAWWWVTGEMPQGEIDHKNNIRHDNRFCNLRKASSTQNNHNRLKPVTNTSGVKGVNWHKHRGAWVARVTVNGHRVHLGYFDELSAAERAVRDAREYLHGEFCNHG